MLDFRNSKSYNRREGNVDIMSTMTATVQSGPSATFDEVVLAESGDVKSPILATSL